MADNNRKEKEKLKQEKVEKKLERNGSFKNSEIKETLLDFAPAAEKEMDLEIEDGDIVFEEEPEEEGGHLGEKATIKTPKQTKIKKKRVDKKRLRVKKIETVLAQGFRELYIQLPSNLKTEFKKKGEEAARKIDEVVISDKNVKASKILEIIKKWLSFLKKIPGISKFFLEQEAKIKTDKILRMHEQKEKNSKS
jgi:hypothetical protein